MVLCYQQLRKWRQAGISFVLTGQQACGPRIFRTYNQWQSLFRFDQAGKLFLLFLEQQLKRCDLSTAQINLTHNIRFRQVKKAFRFRKNNQNTATSKNVNCGDKKIVIMYKALWITIIIQQDRLISVDPGHFNIRTKLWIHWEADFVIAQLNNHNLKNNDHIGCSGCLKRVKCVLSIMSQQKMDTFLCCILTAFFSTCSLNRW